MPVEVIMPKVDMDMTTGTIATWHIKEGALVEKGDPLFDIETDKATMEVESPAAGSLQFVVANSGDIVEIGKCVGWIFSDGEALEQPDAAHSGSQPVTLPGNEINNPSNCADSNTHKQSTFTGKSVRATPHARRIARQHGIDLQLVSGNGPLGRITRADVEAYRSAGTGQSAATPVNTSMALTQKLDMAGIAYDTAPVDRMRHAIARRLTESKSSIPHFYLEVDCLVDRLLEHRQKANSALLQNGQRISVNDMLVRASAQALMAVPQANASWAGDQIIRYKDAHVSVAVSIEGGLVTPVVRQAQSKSVNRISNEIKDLAERARNGALKNADYEGGSFSISNLGMYGVKSFSAIINPPQSMILAVGDTQRVFVPDSDDNPVARSVMSVVLSCDHRVVDGVLGAQWLAEFKRIVENPVLLGMDLG